MNVKASERTEEKTVRCREIIGLSGTRAWREASNASVCVCVYVSHERLLFSDKYIVLISVCVGTAVSVCRPPAQPGPCATHSEMTESQSVLPLRFVSQRVFDPAAHEHTHTHTSLGDFPWDGEHRGGHSQRERVKVRAYSSLPTNSNLTFSGF